MFAKIKILFSIDKDIVMEYKQKRIQFQIKEMFKRLNFILKKVTLSNKFIYIFF